jgi:hypothetical protein
MSERTKKIDREVWENTLRPLGKEGLSLLSIDSMKEANEIIDAFFVPDKIYPLRFLNNFEALGLQGASPSERVFLGLKESDETTHSLSQYTAVMDRPSGMPLWFIAAYPDVLLWHENQVAEYIETRGPDEDSLAAFSTEWLGFDPTDPNLEEKLRDSVDKEGKFRPSALRNLVQSYKDKTSRELETAAEIPAEDMCLASEFYEAFGAENNFTFIAVNTTKYYLELARGYHDRFKNEVCLLATSGVLDAQYCVMKQTVKPSEILEMAEGAIVHAEEALLDFIIRLEIKLFTVDNPSMDISDIEMACLDQKAGIADAIERTKNEYIGEPMFALGVSNFMNSRKFRELRRILGLKG